MKLIRELISESEVLYEENNGKKELYIKGVFLVAETKNQNGRIYPQSVMDNAVQKYTEDYINQNKALGELQHPESPSISLERASHLIKELKKDGNCYIGKAKILETPMGIIARGLLEGGVKIGTSSRGMGSLKEVNGTNVVQSDFVLATAGDLVANPSAPGAWLDMVMENVDWIYTNGMWTQQQIHETQKQIRKTSKKDIEKVSLQIFENFIQKL